MVNDTTVDVLIVGAGPSGLACAIEAERHGASTRVIEQGSLVDAIRRFPTQMVFFTTRELLEIGGLPMTCASSKPTRAEALAYYRAVVHHFHLDVHCYERAEVVSRSDEGEFEVITRTRFRQPRRHRGRRLIIATGYYDHPNLIGVDGEDLPHVSHYFREAHEAAGQDVVVIGGGNSAAEAALELFRVAARVTLVVRRSDFDSTVKYWVRPDVLNRVRAGEIAARFETRVVRIREDAVDVIDANDEEDEIPAAFVFALTGYRPDVEFLRSCGIRVGETSLEPTLDDSYQTNVPGLYLAGSVGAGRRTSDLFIENGRLHAERIVPHLVRSLEQPT